ncbi:M48 family metallopeptidase [Actinoplanes sp. N902-109]|uniref:M48 family metallopeptidase n=1 Tax=Actinoplanes sp. (strain N902-109) TaxID=649831 RepID=UPI00068782C9|nr:M48 family metallopeptidase [Actinoplanes sp. N902-109]
MQKWVWTSASALAGFLAVAALQLALVVVPVMLVLSTLPGSAALRIGLPVCMATVGVMAYATWRALHTRRPEPVGIPVTRQDAPDLWALLDEAAAAAGTRTPDRLTIVADAVARVIERTRLLGLTGGRRDFYLGLPLLQAWDIEHLRAAAAHELAHFSPRLGRLAPLAWRGRTAVARVVPRISRRNPAGPLLRTYANFYRRVDAPFTRAQELQADRIAAEFAGPAAAAAVLRDLPALDAVHRVFHAEYLGPGWQAGHVPDDIFGGFLRVLSARAEDIAILRAREPAPPATWDTHPPRQERLAALALATATTKGPATRDATGPAPADSAPAAPAPVPSSSAVSSSALSSSSASSSSASSSSGSSPLSSSTAPGAAGSAPGSSGSAPDRPGVVPPSAEGQGASSAAKSQSSTDGAPADGSVSPADATESSLAGATASGAVLSFSEAGGALTGVAGASGSDAGGTGSDGARVSGTGGGSVGLAERAEEAMRPMPGRSAGARPALSLVPDLPGLGRALQQVAYPPQGRTRVGWDEFFGAARTTEMQREAESALSTLSRVAGSPVTTVSDVLDLTADGRLHKIAESVFPGLPPDEMTARIRELVTLLLALAALRSGVARWRHSWTGTAELVAADGAHLDLGGVAALAVDQAGVGAARERLAELGIDIAAAPSADLPPARPEVVGGIVNLVVDGARTDVLIVDTGLVLVPGLPRSQNGSAKRRLAQIAAADPARPGAETRFVAYADVVTATQAKRRSWVLTMRDGSTLSVRAALDSDELPGGWSAFDEAVEFLTRTR